MKEIKVFNQSFKIKSDENEGQVAEIAEYVNNKIKEIQESTKTVATLNVAILTALNIAYDYFSVRGKYEGVALRYEDRARALIEKVDEALINSETQGQPI